VVATRRSRVLDRRALSWFVLTLVLENGLVTDGIASLHDEIIYELFICIKMDNVRTFDVT